MLVGISVSFQDDLQRLFPGHVVKLDRDQAGHFGTDNDVHAAFIGKYFQDIGDIGVAKIQTDVAFMRIGSFSFNSLRIIRDRGNLWLTLRVHIPTQKSEHAQQHNPPFRNDHSIPPC